MSDDQERGSTAAAPVEPIRAVLRGLDVLAVLNASDGLSVTEVAKRARLPRTTAHRILETLVVGGYVRRDPIDERFRPTDWAKGPGVSLAHADGQRV